MEPVDPDALSFLPISCAIGGECVVLDHHAGTIKVIDLEDAEVLPVVLDEAAMSARGLSMPEVVPMLPGEVIE